METLGIHPVPRARPYRNAAPPTRSSKGWPCAREMRARPGPATEVKFLTLLRICTDTEGVCVCVGGGLGFSLALGASAVCCVPQLLLRRPETRRGRAVCTLELVRRVSSLFMILGKTGHIVRAELHHLPPHVDTMSSVFGPIAQA